MKVEEWLLRCPLYSNVRHLTVHHCVGKYDMAADHRVWSFYPELHPLVAHSLQMDYLHFSFHDQDDDGYLRSYDTYVTGELSCQTPRCPNARWPCSTIPVTIRTYPNQGYNAKVFHLMCRNCGQATRPLLYESYAERVAYCLKLWARVEMEPPGPVSARTVMEPPPSRIQPYLGRQVPVESANIINQAVPIPDREMQLQPVTIQPRQLMQPVWAQDMIPNPRSGREPRPPPVIVRSHPAMAINGAHPAMAINGEVPDIPDIQVTHPDGYPGS